MWMMGCSDAGSLNASDSFNGGTRKLRPLIPRSTQIPSSSSCAPSTNSCFGRTHGNDLFSLRNHILAEHGKRELGTQQVSSRWNPTPEQLRTLEDLYRRGTRTPTAEQIQHITAQLRRFGKIEGKNVFYWFQNHKARERQKRRRRIEAEERDLSDSSEKKESLGLQTDHETKSWSASTNCSTVAEESALMSRPLSEGRRSGEWIHCDPEISQHGLQMKHATWQVVHLLPSPPYLIDATTTTTTASSVDDQGVERQTLQLFPLHSDLSVPDERAALPSNFGPLQFYQFLPLKN